MVSVASYAAGAAQLVIVVGAAAFAAVRARRRLLPEWSGPPARLAESVLAIGLVVVTGQLLGAVGLFRESAFVVAIVFAAGTVALLSGRGAGPGTRSDPQGSDPEGSDPGGSQGSTGARSDPEGSDPGGSGSDPGGSEGSAAGAGSWARPPTRLELLVAVGIVAVLFAHWGFETQQSLNNAITNFDTRWYHLPFAVELARGGWATELVFTDPLFLNWFYPLNAELLGAVAILLTERDTLALFLNLGWLGLALLAAWCAGQALGRGPHAVAAAAILLESHTLVVREPGSLKNDVAAGALVLAAAALLLNAAAQPGGAGRLGRVTGGALPAGVLAVAGLAAGLAIGTKLTALAPVAALTLAVLVLAPAGRRLAAAAWWGIPLLAGGGFWYLHNLVVAANPLPWITELGPLTLPGPERLAEARPPFSVAHYATDPGIWVDWFGPGLAGAFGPLWPLVVAGAVAGMGLALIGGLRRRLPAAPILAALGAVGLVSVLAYLLTPLSAAGEEGMPVAFEINVRFAIPPLLLGLVLLAATIPARTPAARWALLAALLVVLAITNEPFELLSAPERAAGAAIAFAFVLGPAALLVLRRRGLPRPLLAAALVLLGVAVLAAGYGVQRNYLESRYERFDSAVHIDDAWRFADRRRGARIGLAGTVAAFHRHGFYGRELSNDVIYLGREGPRGAFAAYGSCRELRRAVNEAELDYLVTAPDIDFARSRGGGEGPAIEPSSEARWLGGADGLDAVSVEQGVTVWRLTGRLDPNACPGG